MKTEEVKTPEVFVPEFVFNQPPPRKWVPPEFKEANKEIPKPTVLKVTNDGQFDMTFSSSRFNEDSLNDFSPESSFNNQENFRRALQDCVPQNAAEIVQKIVDVKIYGQPSE